MNFEGIYTNYKNDLINDTLPFWVNNCIDYKDGGFNFALDEKGKIFDTDKGVWGHGRFVWTLSTAYLDIQQNPEWLKLARHGLDFLKKHAFDTDGRMFFSLDKKGNPLRKRRYIFSEAFMVMGLAAFSRASGESKYAQEALALFRLMDKYLTTPGLLPPKYTDHRQSKGLAIPMIMIVVAQELRKVIDDPLITKWIDHSITEIENDFLKEEYKAVLEMVGPKGEFIDSCNGRLLNPGHAIEAAWFILHESKYRNNDTYLRNLGLKILDYMWEWAWDLKYGGILYYRDVLNRPPTEYWHDMKFWWNHNEAIIATLSAYQMTGNKKYARWHRLVHEWSYQHFPDKENGEWYGYLHRDGSISTPIKGNSIWKGPFHLPRMQWYCSLLIDEMKENGVPQ